MEFIEQPMPAHMFQETKYIRSKVHMPIIADEACTDASMIPQLKEAYDGIRKQNEAMKELVAQRDEFVKKLNDSVKERNDVVAKYNDLAAQAAKLQGGKQ